MKGIYRYLKDEHMHIYGKELEGRTWKMVSYPKGVPQQENGKCSG